MRLQQYFLLVCGFLLPSLTGLSSLLAGEHRPYSDPSGNIRLEQLTTHDGLSQNTVRCLLQDKKGFIWVGTLNGLNRYDGRKFTVYRTNQGLPKPISDNRIRSLYEDKSGIIWVKTAEGHYHCFDPGKESFVNVIPDSADLTYDHLYEASKGVWLFSKSNGCLHNGRRYALGSVHFVFEDPQHQVWIGTDKHLYKLDARGNAIAAYEGNFIKAMAKEQQLYFVEQQGLIVYDNATQKTALIDLNALPAGAILTDAAILRNDIMLLGTQQHGLQIINVKSNQLISVTKLFGEEIPGHIDIETDQDHGIWVNNHSGNVWYFDPEQEFSQRISLIPANVMKVIDDCRFAFAADHKGKVWITTYGGGLYCFDKLNRQVQRFVYDPDNPNGLSTNYLLSVIADRSGLIWVGAEHTGLQKLTPQSLHVTHIFPEAQTPERYAANGVKTIFEDSYHRIWVSTRNGALYLYNDHLEKNRSLEHLLPGQCANIYCMTEDPKGYLWIGTKGDGVYIVHRDSLQQKARHFLLPTGDNRLVYTIMQDRQQRMWVGTFGSGLYLANYHGGNSLEWKSFFHDGVNPVYIRCLMQDKQNQLWAGTNNGLLVFNPDNLLAGNNKVTTYQAGLGSNEIKSLCEDHKGRIWIGTTGGGFSQFVRKKFINYTTEQGLSHDVVNSMLEDAQGNLWISTENGLTRFNPEKSTFEVFYFANNALGNLFSEGACFKRENGQLLWGSMNGFYSFFPEQLKNGNGDAPVLLTGLSVAGNPVALEESISTAKAITLEPGQKVFSISFASLAFRNPQQNKYTYILENYEDEWNAPSSYNVATYRNLPPGKYTFKVRGTNDDGTWSKQVARIQLIVLPPFWRSNIAIILYLGLIICLIMGVRTVNKRIHRLQHAVTLEKELTEYKLNFFTDISHEFRTPLSLIVSAMEQLLPAKQSGKHLYIMQRQVAHLMRLADQLLDFRKIQHNKLQLQVQETEVIQFIQDICNGFTDLAAQKQITLNFQANVDACMAWVDQGKLDKMLYNLLSNAHKFTPTGGKIDLIITVDTQLSIKVTDNGIAISSEKQHLVFQRFTQLTFSPTGTGLGLSLTKELVTLHKGEISFENNADAGVTFTINLPIHKQAYQADEIALQIVSKTPVIPFIDDTDTAEVPQPSSRYNVLIIEDNADIAAYLATTLGRYFHIDTAANGREGLEQAIAQSPDLIVCDVMLPEMSGLDITHKIRNEFQTCHIPVVLLTALSSGEHQLQGINAGADAYITKPFSTRFLLTTIIRIIEQREKIRKRFANDPGFFAVHISENEADQLFLEKINMIIEKNLDNAQFSVDDFALSMKMGRTLFYKKVKGLTGYSPNEYIRLVRVKKAAELLNTGEYTVAEVAYKVGMNDPFYFSKCFKTQFGVPPSIHLKKVKAAG